MNLIFQIEKISLGGGESEAIRSSGKNQIHNQSEIKTQNENVGRRSFLILVITGTCADLAPAPPPSPPIPPLLTDGK